MRSIQSLFLKISLVILSATFPLALSFGGGGIGVFTFAVNGPSDTQYLATAAQDAVIGSLIKRGQLSQAIKKIVDPDKLGYGQLEKGKYSLVLAGRINVVGQTYRVLLKWVDTSGKEGQEYLQVSDINQLLPQIENFARNNLPTGPTAIALAPVLPPAPVPVSPPPAKKSEAVKPAPIKTVVTEAQPSEMEAPAPTVETPTAKVTKKEKIKEPAPVQVAPLPPPLPVVEAKPPKKIKVREVQPVAGEALHDYSNMSQKLPFEVRGMAYGDADGDGTPEVLLTGKTELHVYRYQEGQLQELASLSGKKLDYFVKVDILPNSGGGKPLIALTNLRGSQAASQILSLEGGQLQIQAENIPYQLRVVQQGNDALLVGESYHAKETSRHQIYELKLLGNKVETTSKLDLPYDVGLYSFDWVPNASGNGFDLFTLSPSGKLFFYQSENGKMKKVWSSRENYGGSANDVEVEVKDFFNEITHDFYLVPVGLHAITSTVPELVVVKNDSLLKDIVGRKPVITDGRLIHLKRDQLGFAEAWESKKVDGSILDYRVIPANGGLQLLAAIRLRNPGLLGDVGNHGSVLLTYHLN